MITKKKAKKGKTLSKRPGENKRSRLCDIGNLGFSALLIFLTETINSAFGIHELRFTCKKRMAG